MGTAGYLSSCTYTPPCVPAVPSPSAVGTGAASLVYDVGTTMSADTSIRCPYVADSCTSDSTTKSYLWACGAEKVSGSLTVGVVTLTQGYVGTASSGTNPTYVLNVATVG